MKKYMCLWILLFLLCGCSMTAETDTASVPERQTLEYYVDEDNSVDYQDESEFLKSEFCDAMRQTGHTVYSISCDAERYTLLGITSDASFYRYSYLDKETNQAVECSVSYGVDYMKHPSDAFANADDTSGDQVVTVEKDGQNVDVYIARTPHIEKDEYNIVYLPYTGYKMSIYSDAPTPEEALSYLHEFDLVPVEAGSE